MKCEFVVLTMKARQKLRTCIPYPPDMRYLRCNILFLQLPALLFLLSCKPDSLPANKDTNKLYQSFHGKYEIISSFASEPIDLNLDGVSSSDLLTELQDLAVSHLEIRISQIFSFHQFWPEPYFPGFGETMPATYDPRIFPGYAMQGVTRQFEFDEKVEQIILLADPPFINQTRFPRPTSIKLILGEMIEVTISKTFYTSSGIKNVQVVSLYRRYTMVT